MRGKKTKLTPAVRRTIIRCIKAGAPNEIAAALAGIGEATFYQWLARGRGESGRKKLPIYVEFVEAVEKAEAVFLQTHLETVRRAGSYPTVEELEKDPSAGISKERITVKTGANGETVEEIITERDPARWSAWLLEHRFPVLFGKQVMEQKVKHSGKVDTGGETVVRFEFVDAQDGKPANSAETEDDAVIDPGPEQA